MARRWRVVGATVSALIVGTSLAATGTASAVGLAQGSMPVIIPSTATPSIPDTANIATEKVLDIEAIGGLVVVAGQFNAVRNPGSTTNITRTYVFAFDPSTGVVNTAFNPTVSGPVRTIAAGPNGTVFLGGIFGNVNGNTAVRNLAQVNLSNGQLTAFRPGALNGSVEDLAVRDSRLYVGGTFTTVGGVAHGGLATYALNTTTNTGTLDPFMGVDLAVNHNYPNGTARSAVGVENFDISPDGTRMIVIGNFKQAEGQARDQAVLLDLDGPSAVVDPNWRTRRYEPACALNAFDSYVRDVDFSPTGSFFAIVTTGAKFAGTLCDTIARFDTATTGQDVQPAWIDYAGGDSMFSVVVSDVAVYAGGHQRWMNNTAGADSAGQGAVPRPGLAAVDVRNGMPLAWNPGRNPRGVGAEALALTPNGIYVGMDTQYFGVNPRYTRPRLGFFPLAGGKQVAPDNIGSLPGDVYLGGRATAVTGAGVDDLLRRTFTDATTAQPATVQPNGGINWGSVRGAFVAGGVLFYGYPDAANGNAYRLFRRTFDGTNFGTATALDPYNDPIWSNVSAGTRNGVTSYYRGALPTFYSQLSGVTGMFYSNGRLYYTRTGSSALFYRYFTTDSGVVGADEFSVATTGWNNINGMFLNPGNNRLYYISSTDGQLRSVAWTGTAPTGTATVVSTDNWRTRAAFIAP
jgi:hypothetical protein